MGVVNWYLDWCDRWIPGYTRSTTDDQPAEAPCARCGAVIAYDSRECPECGNRPIETVKRNSVIFMLAGFVFSLTVVGAIVGVPLFALGLLQRMTMGASDWSPTEHDF